MRKGRLAVGFGAIALVVLALDQWTKALTRTHIPVGEIRPFMPGFLELTHIHNRGAAFGMFQGYAVQLAIVAIIVVLALAFVVIARRKTSIMEMVSFGLIVGGAVGNLVDRITQGYVTDMIKTAFIEFPVFNVADSAVTVGAILFAIWAVFFASYDEHPEDPSDADDGRGTVDG